jgi:uncharacterized protein with HEPN domain
MRDNAGRLQDIQEAIARIEQYADRGQDALPDDELLRTWVIYHLRVIDDALEALALTLNDQHPELAWSQQAAMRRALREDPFDADPEVFWTAVKHDLPLLQAYIEPILLDLGSKP